MLTCASGDHVCVLTSAHLELLRSYSFNRQTLHPHIHSSYCSWIVTHLPHQCVCWLVRLVPLQYKFKNTVTISNHQNMHIYSCNEYNFPYNKPHIKPLECPPSTSPMFIDMLIITYHVEIDVIINWSNTHSISVRPLEAQQVHACVLIMYAWVCWFISTNSSCCRVHSSGHCLHCRSFHRQFLNQ